MADVKMPKSIPCKFDAESWAPCKKPSDNGWCSEHEHLKCVSCGEKAVKSCSHEMGGLLCGVSICGTCEHGESGEHITKEVAEKRRQEKQKKEEDLIASRTSPTQQMDDKLGVPATLFELFKGNWQEDGYQFMKLYFLELKHGLMGCYPAVFSSDKKRIVFTTDLRLLERVWQNLEPRESKIRSLLAYVNLGLNIGYIDPESPDDREKMKPFRILSIAELEGLAGKEKPFWWAFGLINKNISQDHFLEQLTKQASILDPTFADITAT